MAWLVLIAIFWKPIVNLVMFVVTKDTNYKSNVYDWFSHLWALISPN